MPDLISVYKTGPATTFVLGADRLSQNEAGNYTTVRFYLKATNGPGGSTESRFLDWGQQQGHVEGLTHFGTHAGKPFLPSGVANGATRWLDVYDVNIGHGADGNRGPVTVRMYLGYGGVDESHYATFSDFPRIAKAPSKPPTPTISNVTAGSARVNGSAPADNGGAGITSYEFQAATDAAFTAGVVSSSNAGAVHDLGGLTPGQRYWFRYRAVNRRGASAWSDTADAFVGLPAPTLLSWTQDAFGQLVASWTAPAVTTGLIGYRLQLARDAGFTTGVQNIDLGDVAGHAVAGLAGGRYWFARVAAVTAGGVNAYSGALSALLILSAGDLDGWQRVGVLPAGMAAFTAEGIRRGAAGGVPALLVENLATAATGLPADVFGIERTVAGLIPGRAYRFEASGQLTDPAAPATRYRLAVVNEAAAADVELQTAPTSLGYIEFVADATTATLQIMLAEAVAVAGATDLVERAAFSRITLRELSTDYPVRLRSTVYESNLANHFDLACNSAGASWYVGKDGVTRFRLPGAALPISAVFTDQPDPDALHYVDLAVAYDTRGMVNRLDVTNYGVSEDGETEQNTDLVVVAQGSIDSYGVRSGRLEVNLWDQPPYGDSLADRLAEILADAAEPRLFVSSIRWNAQENPSAANALDVGQRVLVEFNGTTQDSQIVALQHDITPRRWIVTATLRGI